MNLRFLFPPLRERWLTQSWYPWSGIWSFHSHLFVRGDNTIAQHFMSVDIRFNSHLCVRGDLEWFQILTTLSCFYSHLCTRGDTVLCRESRLTLGFHSHLCVRGDKKLNTRTKNIIVSIHTSAWEVTEMAREISNELMQFPFTPLRERWRQGNFCKSHEGNVSIPTSEWEVTYYGTAFHECGHSFLFTPLRERWHINRL